MLDQPPQHRILEGTLAVLALIVLGMVIDPAARVLASGQMAWILSGWCPRVQGSAAA